MKPQHRPQNTSLTAQSEALPPRVPLCSVMPNPTDVMKSSSALPQQSFDESSSHSPACVTVPINANHVEIPAGSRQPDQAFVAGATLQENPRCEDRSGDDGRLSPTDVRTDGAANCQLWQDNSRPLVPRRDRERKRRGANGWRIISTLPLKSNIERSSCTWSSTRPRRKRRNERS